LAERSSLYCDTEVVLTAYVRYGRRCVEEVRGAFAFPIWDSRSREQFPVGDRLGIKPLDYFRGSGRYLFASQVKALLASGLVVDRLSRSLAVTW
jgi:asparagine synthase (glutamine-hydrolysing)